MSTLTLDQCAPSLDACADVIHLNAWSRRRDAHDMALKRARALGYCKTTAQQLANRCRQDIRPGETPEACVQRIVVRPHRSATAPTLPEAG